MVETMGGAVETSGSLTCCLACGSGTTEASVGGTSMAICTACGMGRLPRSDGGDDYWQRTGDAQAALRDEYWTRAKSPVFTAALELLAADVGIGRIVDVGGGVGHFAECALARGWDAYSLDVSPHAARAAAERLGPERSLSGLPSELRGTCDAVTLWCVIAHVDDPRRVIADAVSLLRPEGRLFLTTPNFRFQRQYARFLAAIGKPVDFAALEHFLHFSPAALDRVLHDCGLRTWRYEHIGVTESCSFERRLTRLAVPAKKAWNRGAMAVSGRGKPSWCSELQVVAVNRA